MVATAGTATYAGALTALEVPDVETAGTSTLKETADCSTDSGAVAALGCAYPEDDNFSIIADLLEKIIY